MRRVATRLSALALVASLGAGLALPAVAAEPADVIKYRQTVMKSLGTHFGAISAISKGEVPFTDQAAGHAQAIATVSADIPALFPAGTEAGAETDALPSIWENPTGFAEAAQATVDAAKVLVAAGDVDAAEIETLFKEIGRTCGSCHTDFRAKN